MMSFNFFYLVIPLMTAFAFSHFEFRGSPPFSDNPCGVNRIMQESFMRDFAFMREK
jgi:hypothetical protein